jgi:osmotically inducible lipoprotein OsmB
MSQRRFGSRWGLAHVMVVVLSLQACDSIDKGDRHVLSGSAVGAVAGAVLGAVIGSSVAGAILGGVVGMAVSSFATKDRPPADRRPARK